MSQTVRLIGIDFGTSTSVVKVKRYRSGEPIGDSYITNGVTFGNGDADTKASTIVRRNGDGSFTCGADAAEAVPDSTIFREFKMELEDQDPEKRQQARELTAAFFRYLYERYDHQRSDLGEIDDEERTLVSLPVKWGEETRQFMAQAAEKAGFRRVSIMDEPTAALYATLCRKMSEINQQGLLRAGESGYLLLVDMGAGTTDLAVCRYTVDSRPGEIIRADRIKNEIVATWPEDRNAATFGGREVDRVLEDYVEAYLKDCGLPDAMAAQMVRGTASSSAKLWKETAVSKNLNEGKRVETCAFVSGYMAFLPQQKPFPAFGRTEMETMLGDKLAQFKGLVAECLQRASEAEPEVLSKGLDLVILTGGHSSWYFTEELLNGIMPGLALSQLERVQREKSRVIRLTNPQETVALGLVYSRLPFQVGKKEEPKPEPRLEPKPEPKPEPGGNGGASSDTIEMQVRVNGKVRTAIRVPARAGQDTVFAIAASDNKVRQVIDRMTPIDVIWSPGRYIDLRGDYSSGQMNEIEVQVNGETCTTIQVVCPLGAMTGGDLRTVFAAAMAYSKVRQAIDGLDVQSVEYFSGRFINLICTPRAKQPSEPEPVPAGTPQWDDRLLPRIKEYFQRNPIRFLPDIKANTLLRLRQNLDIPEHIEIYAAHDSTLFHSGKEGFAICSDGIHISGNGPVYIDWPLFFQGEIREYVTALLLVFNGNTTFLANAASIDRRKLQTYYENLQAYLRKCSMEL